MRGIFGILLLLAALVIIFLTKPLYSFGIENDFSWTFSAVAPWILVFIFSVIGSLLIAKKLNSKPGRVITYIALPLALLGGMFAVNPIYTADYKKKGTSLQIKSHELIDIVESYKEDFDGLVAVVDYNCPFCRMVTSGTLNHINSRDTDIDLALTLNTADRETVDSYAQETNSVDLDYIVHKPSAEIIKLNDGVFPTFFYIKDGKVLHKWKNSQLGYPALDWIENGLE